IAFLTCAQATASDGLVAYRESLSRLRSFDVVVTAVTEFHKKSVPHQIESRGRMVQAVKVVEYEPGEPRDKETAVSRQVWEWTGRSRVELGGEADHWTEKSVFDGETMQTLQTVTLEGVISGEE